MIPRKEIRLFETELNGKLIKYRPWKTKEEKEYLVLSEIEDEMPLEKLYNAMVLPCLENPEIELSSIEKEVLMVKIRQKSVGESIEFSYKCVNEECNKVAESEIQIEDMYQYTPSLLDSVTFDEITVTFKKTIPDDTNEYNAKEQLFMEFVNAVESITIDNEVYKDFTLAEIADYFDDMEAMDFDKFYGYYHENKESILYYAEAECLFCGTLQNINIDQIPNFFPW